VFVGYASSKYFDAWRRNLQGDNRVHMDVTPIKEERGFHCGGDFLARFLLLDRCLCRSDGKKSYHTEGLLLNFILEREVWLLSASV